MLFLFLIFGSTFSQEIPGTWIKSPETTSWGKWGPPQQCPPNHFANSLILKYESKQLFGDSTALNGVQLYCSPFTPQFLGPPSNWEKEKYLKPSLFIASSVAPFGSWLKEFHSCPRGISVGFQLRSEVYQGDYDDTSANDMTLRCVDFEGNELMTSAGHGGSAGSWTKEQLCPRGSGICGIQTQIEENQGNGDDTALNNVNLKCCPVPGNPGYNCVVKEEKEVITSGLSVSSDRTFKVNYKIGFSLKSSKEVSQTQALVDALAFSKSFGPRDKLIKELRSKMESKIESSQRNETFLVSDKIHTKKYSELPSNCVKVQVTQDIVRCGSFVAKTPILEYICI